MNTTRRNFIAGSLLSPLVSAAATPDRPNVLVVVLDDLGCHDLGYLGAADLKTPHIDAIAQRGLKFRNWYSNAPVCAPARSAILTGCFPASAGVADNGLPLAHGIPTIASAVKSAAYRTACFGKWHLGNTNETAPTGHGFDSFYGFHSGCVDYYSHRYYWGDNYHDLWRNRTEIFEDGQYLTDRIADEAVDYISRNRGNPFFGYIAFNAPHYPMHAPEKYKARFPGLAKERQTYAAMIAAVDDGMGRIERALETAGVDGSDILDTLVDGAPSPHKSLYWSQGGQLATRRGPWKLVVNGRLYDRRANGDKPLEGEDSVWLSNLDDDPGETRNLRRVHANLVDELLTDLYRWRDALRQPE